MATPTLTEITRLGALYQIGRLCRGAQSREQGLGLQQAWVVGEHDDKVVTAGAGHDILSADGASEPLRQARTAADLQPDG